MRENNSFTREKVTNLSNIQFRRIFKVPDQSPLKEQAHSKNKCQAISNFCPILKVSSRNIGTVQGKSRDQMISTKKSRNLNKNDTVSRVIRYETHLKERKKCSMVPVGSIKKHPIIIDPLKQIYNDFPNSQILRKRRYNSPFRILMQSINSARKLHYSLDLLFNSPKIWRYAPSQDTEN